MKDQIKEKIALCRLLLSISLLIIIGLVGWIYRAYTDCKINELILGVIVLLTFIMFSIIFTIKIYKIY